CDPSYRHEAAQLAGPVVRLAAPDRRFHAWLLGMRKAMAMMLTGDSISGIEAVEYGWANKAFPVEELDRRVLEIAERVALMPPDMVQLNKRLVHRGMETMGLRTAIRHGTELCALGTHQPTLRAFVNRLPADGL